MWKHLSKPRLALATTAGFISILLLGFQNCTDFSFKTIEKMESLNVREGNSSEPLPPLEDPTEIVLPTLGDYASIAFEDNVHDPAAGDRDYNDAVFNYNITEKYNAQNELTDLVIKVKVREMKSGGNHNLYLYFNGNPSADFTNISHISVPAFNGMANIEMKGPDGVVTNHYAVNHLLIVNGTSGAVGDEYLLEVELISPGLNKVSILADFIDFRKYRFVLQNQGSSLGIDISEINSTDEMLAEDGYPLGFMIPTDWQPPGETQLIDELYPNFILYRNWLSGDQKTPPDEATLNWFL